MKKILFTILLMIFALTSNAATLVKEDKLPQSNNTEEITTDFNDDFEDDFDEVKKVFDPLSRYNRDMTSINDMLFMNVFSPVSKIYAKFVHKNIKRGASNFYENLLFPVHFINNILQFKFFNATEEFGRFTINSTFGVLGIVDLASDINLKEHKEDFGQTLGFYGVGGGFPVVIPFVGPSNLRDFLGEIVDSFVNPLSLLMVYEPYQIPNNVFQEFGYGGYIILNEYSLNPASYEDLKKEAIDLYPFLRDIYEQRRKKLIEE